LALGEELEGYENGASHIEKAETVRIVERVAGRNKLDSRSCW
jgi:hypothetical protein